MIVITSGNKYIDIDAYASMIAYREYLKEKGIKCVAISNSVLNDSITESIRNMTPKLDNYIPNSNDKFIILDVSETAMLDKSVIEKNVVEIIDHHYGYEEYWNSRLGDRAQIEAVGAVATVIYEKILEDHFKDIITIDIAKMLVSAILDNTLNLKAKITTHRDVNAYNDLMAIIHDNNYPNKYYEEIENKVKENVVESLRNETNIYQIPRIIPPYFSQLVIFDKKIVLDKLDKIYLEFSKLMKDYIINLICLSEGKSYIITPCDKVKEDMAYLFNSNFNNDIMELDDIWLRKEIIKKAKELITINYSEIANEEKVCK